MFVGRAHELEQLEGALATSGATVLVTGDAGIGKTRLVSELAARCECEVLLGRAIDLVGTELPYQPFVEALGELPRETGSQLRVFETALGRLTSRAPVLLVLEDLHWADASTLDLVVFLAHNLHDRHVLLVATCREDERVRRLADGVRRSGSGLVVELGPLAPEELTELLGASEPAIVARSEGNPFFALELRAAGGELSRDLRDLLLERVARLDRSTQGVLRVAAAAGRDVGYPLLRAVAEGGVRESLRLAVEHGVLVAGESTFRFRHALLAEAVYSTILPGEREELHGRLADELAGSASAAELAPHWAAAGRSAEAFAASVEAARAAEAVFALPEALAHAERALALWPSVPDPGLDLAELCSWAAELAGQIGAAPRAVELGRRAIELEPDAALLRVGVGRFLFASGHADEALVEFERAVELSRSAVERAQALAALGHGLSLAWRYEESLAICRQALELARAVGSRPAELRALTVLGVDLAYLGHGDEGLEQMRLALELAEESADPVALQRAYINLTDALMMLGRPRESARLAAEARPVFRRYALDETTLVANRVEALVACGEWDTADGESAAALRAITGSYPHQPLVNRGELEVGRGAFADARAHFEAAAATLRLDRDVATYQTFVAELALWERRWTDADEAVRAGLSRARSREMAQIRVWLCAKGLRAEADLAALARARRDAGRVGRADELLATARAAAADSSGVTPNAAGWLALAEAEYERAQPSLWSGAAEVWERLERPPLAAYCRWRQAEALVALGAPRAEAVAPLREAFGIAARLGARPLLCEIELLAERARLDPRPLDTGPPAEPLQEILGLTPREAEVLTLVSRGLTNREIAGELVISVKTASVHVSHILRKLDAPNRLEAAAIAQRVRR